MVKVESWKLFAVALGGFNWLVISMSFVNINRRNSVNISVFKRTPRIKIATSFLCFNSLIANVCYCLVAFKKLSSIDVFSREARNEQKYSIYMGITWKTNWYIKLKMLLDVL